MQEEAFPDAYHALLFGGRQVFDNVYEVNDTVNDVSDASASASGCDNVEKAFQEQVDFLGDQVFL